MRLRKGGIRVQQITNVMEGSDYQNTGKAADFRHGSTLLDCEKVVPIEQGNHILSGLLVKGAATMMFGRTGLRPGIRAYSQRRDRPEGREAACQQAGCIPPTRHDWFILDYILQTPAYTFLNNVAVRKSSLTVPEHSQIVWGDYYTLSDTSDESFGDVLGALLPRTHRRQLLWWCDSIQL